MKALKLQLLKAGYCIHPEKITIKNGSYRTVQFPALVGLMEHPTKGYILMDTGYSDHFFRASSAFPYSIYPKITPVHYTEVDSVSSQLVNMGIDPREIQHIMISHFHGDHIGGLHDFPNARFYCMKNAYDHVHDLKGFRALKAGFLPDLLPEDFDARVVFVDEQRQIALPNQLAPFEKGFDLFGDGSLYALDLTGHAIGQMGLFLKDEIAGDTLLCADACWQSRSYRDNILPSTIAFFIMPDRKAYKVNLDKLHQLHHQNPTIRIIPTHCQEIWEGRK